MDQVNALAKQAILQLQTYISQLGFKPLVHFELEGCFQLYNRSKDFTLNFNKINQQLSLLNIDGTLVPEYWQNQWEYVSSFNGQTPLKEAENLQKAIIYLPQLMAQQGIKKTLIKPVVWGGDKGKLADGCHNIFDGESRDVHIPNAIQMNVSALDENGHNIVATGNFGNILQQQFISTSLSCCLLYLPEEEAFERFSLREQYGLAKELCSPIDISGGHQGSIALYREIGKHNQPMGEHVLVYDHKHQAIATENRWHKTARIEHRLGASSVKYNPYVNVVYGLLNLAQAIERWQQGEQISQNKNTAAIALPRSLYDEHQLGAITLFKQEQWFAKQLDNLTDKITLTDKKIVNTNKVLGSQLKAFILEEYQQQKLVFSC